MIIIGLGAVAGLVLVARSVLDEPRDHRQVLRELIDQAAAAAEERDVKKLRGWLAEDFSDATGRDRQEVSRMLTFMLLRGGAVSAYIMDKTVQVDRTAEPLTARARVTVILTRGAKVEALSDILPHSARAVRFTLRFRLEDDAWKVSSASWEKLDNVRRLLER
jgi:hypothetical protein